MCVQVQLLKEPPAVLPAVKIVRGKRLYVWKASRSAIISHLEWGKNRVKSTPTFPSLSPRRASSRSPDQRSGWPQTATRCGRPWTTCGNRITRMASTIHGRIDKGIIKFDRRLSRWRGDTTASTPFFRESFSKTQFKTKQEESTSYSLIFRQTQNCEVCRRTKVTSAPCRISRDDRADRIKVAENVGDVITADQKVLNEEEESS